MNNKELKREIELKALETTYPLALTKGIKLGRKEREDEIIALMYQIEQQNKEDYESMWDILFKQIKKEQKR